MEGRRKLKEGKGETKFKKRKKTVWKNSKKLSEKIHSFLKFDEMSNLKTYQEALELRH